MGSSKSKPAEIHQPARAEIYQPARAATHQPAAPVRQIQSQEPVRTAELDKPFRKFDWSEKEALKEKLENFSPSHSDVKDIKILVAGQIGAGKSSFINSINNAFSGRITSRALVNTASGDSKSFTRKLKGITIRSGKKNLPFVFKDIMGLEPDALAGSQADDIINAVLGHVKDGYEFNQEQALTHNNEEHYTSDPELSNQSFCLVYVVDGSTIQFTEDKLNDKLKILRKRISKEGIPQVIVMTKVDEACPLVKNDLRKIFNSKKIKEKMEMCSNTIGLPLSNIFPVKNYHDEIDTEDDIDVLILKALDQIVEIADDRLLDGKS